MIGFPKQLLTNRSPELQRKFFSGSNLRMILLVVALTILQGCGGSETNGRGSEPTSSPGCWAPSIICGTAPPAITLTGRISGPVIAGATVCVDRNRNVQCDSGEPSAISDTKGGFNIIDAGDTKGLFLVAHIEVNSIDLNLGPVGKPFFLVGPASNQSELSAFSTLAWSLSLDELISPEEANRRVWMLLDINQGTAASPIASFQDSQSSELLSYRIGGSIALALEALKRLPELSLRFSVRDLTQAAARETRTILIPALVANKTLLAKTNCGLSCTFPAFISDLANELSGELQDISIRSQELIAKSLARPQGSRILEPNLNLFVLTKGRTDYLSTQGTRLPQPAYATSFELTEIQGNNGNLSFSESVTVGNEWRRPYRFQVSEWLWTHDRWLNQITDSRKLNLSEKLNEGCFERVIDPEGLLVSRTCALSSLVGNQVLKEVFPSLCNSESATSSSSTGCSTKLVAEMEAITLQTRWSKAFIRFRTHNDNQYQGFIYQGFPAASPTIERFIMGSLSATQWLGSKCEIGFRFKPDKQDWRTGNIEWGLRTGTSGCGLLARVDWSQKVATSSYSILELDDSVRRKEVITTALPFAAAQVLASDVPRGCRLAFASLTAPNGKDGIYHGAACPNSFIEEISFSGTLERQGAYIVSRESFSTISKLLNWQSPCKFGGLVC